MTEYKLTIKCIDCQHVWPETQPDGDRIKVSDCPRCKSSRGAVIHYIRRSVDEKNM